MFNSIFGTITAKFPKQIFIENNGIEWDICIPDTNLDLLPTVGNSAKIYTWLYHSENAMNLYGFASSDERALFLDLLKVDGLGPKGALKILSSTSSSQLTQILENGDIALLEKIPGVGKKTAAKMMLALKGKLSMNSDERVVTVVKNSPFNDVISSLVSMGYDKKIVEQKISELCERFKNELETKSQKEKEDLLFRSAIVELS